MILAVDIGNTNIKMAFFQGEKVIWSLRLVSQQRASFKHYQQMLKRLLATQKIKRANLDKVIICSVVPKLTPIFKRALFSLFKTPVLILGKDIIAPIKNLYKRPGQVGQDRLANAVAAFSKYGGPTVVVDFGTALTFDLISAKREYLGGIIVPGMELSLEALERKAALLPQITLSAPKTLVGQDTISSMRSGIVYGYGCLVEGILEKLKNKLNKKPVVVATGGAAHLLFPYCPSINQVEENLTLEGLRLSLQGMKRAKKFKKR